MNPLPFVIVGAGQAGVQAAEALRALDADAAIVLLGDEPHGPYHRPPLSKAWLAGEMEAAQLAMRTPEMLERKRIELRTGLRVTAIERAAQALRLADGSTLPYRGLLLATGATPRRLALPGADAPNVHVLRTLDDAAALAASIERCAERGRPVVVIGGGVIGLEVAATARRKKGLEVTVLEAMPRLLARMLTPRMSDWYAALHRGHGVHIVLDARIEAIEVEGGEAVAVRTADGTRHPAGLVLMGVGVEPNDTLAREAGLECDRGIVIDDCGRTADPAIVAAGDCAARRRADGSLLRLESVNSATELGKSAAAALLGQARPFASTPWFWSDQYDRKLQMAGLSTTADEAVLRGSMETNAAFTLFHLRDGRLIAADSVNAPRDHLAVRKLLDAGAAPTREQLADPALDLAALAAAAAKP